MDSGHADFHCYNWVETANSYLKWYKVVIVVGEYSEVARLHSQANTAGGIFFRVFEPRVALCMFEDMMQDGIIRVVVHCYRI